MEALLSLPPLFLALVFIGFPFTLVLLVTATVCNPYKMQADFIEGMLKGFDAAQKAKRQINV